MATQPIQQVTDNPQVTISPNGTYSTVTINNGGVVKFEVSSYPPGTNQCNITLGITFSNQSVVPIKDAAPGTIKIGS